MNSVGVTYSAGVLVDDNIDHFYTWTANNGGVMWQPVPPDTISPHVTLTINTVFTAYNSITITTDNFSAQTCLLTDTLSITTVSDIESPPGFSPNGDSYADYWKIDGIDGYDNISIQIFNRWGGLVWEHTSGKYGGNEWDGTNAKGEPLPSGTYYYIVNYSREGSGNNTLTGSVTILR